jgi:L-fuconolactonase
MIVDAHNHVWVIDRLRYPWQPVGGYLPEISEPVDKLLSIMDASGIDRAVLVQPTPYGWDNSYMVDAVQIYPARLRAVCLVDPHSENSPDQLKGLVDHHGINGVRFNWNLESEFGWSADPAHNHIWEAAQDLEIPVCLQLTCTQIDQAAIIAGRFPGINIVVDHLGRPEPGSDPDSLLFKHFLALAEYSNVYAKLSGLYYFSKQAAPYMDTWPLLKAAMKAFGARRCLWGSDFPFILDRWSCVEMLDTLKGMLEFTLDELDFILGRTAESLGW